MENYEQKYKKALGWMQSLYTGLHGKTREEAETYFPELKESEDERIRKELYDFITCQYGSIDYTHYRSWISWITKRKQESVEQDTEVRDLWVYIREWNEKFGRLPKDEDELASCIDYVMKRYKEPKQEWNDDEIRKAIIAWLKSTRYVPDNQVETLNSWISWLEKQGKLVEYYEDKLDRCACDNFNKGYKAALEKQGEQKYEWSQEDNKNLNSVRWIIEKSENLNRVFETIDSPEYIKKYFIDWLKSLKDRVQPQPKQEWSERDKRIMNELITIMDGGKVTSGTYLSEYIAWLKSLKPNHWKPSEEQMQALFEAKLASIKNREYFLGTLYDDLKKL